MTYQERKEQRIQQAMDTLTIDCDVFGTFAVVSSTSSKIGTYSVTIDESGSVPFAVKCTCDGSAKYHAYCTHMIAVDRTFAKTNMHTIEQEPATYSISEIEAYADTLMRYSEAQDQQALINGLEQAVVKAESDLHEPYETEAAMYQELASTKSVTVIEGCICQGCCKSYRPEHEEQVFCRRCC